MSGTLVILILCSVGGIGIILGCFWLLSAQKIYLDRESRQVSEVELPLGIKLKTNTPVIALVVLGAALLLYAANEGRGLADSIDLEGDVRGVTSAVQVYASIEDAAIPNEGAYAIQLPLTQPRRRYTILYTVGGSVIAHQVFDPSAPAGRRLPTLELSPPDVPELIGDIQPIPSGY